VNAVLGFFIIILILIAGCTSQQKGTSVVSPSSPTGCNLPSTDPVLFQKFLPDVPGYTRTYGQNISGNDNYIKDVKDGDNRITDVYRVSDKSAINVIIVSFSDKGPCVTESTGVHTVLNSSGKGMTVKGTTISRINNFHGYPAIQTIVTSESGECLQDSMYIGITNRLYVTIDTTIRESYVPHKKYSVSEAEADIEKFANATDFNGFASSI
jgi:hypothetical protein